MRGPKTSPAILAAMLLGGLVLLSACAPAAPSPTTAPAKPAPTVAPAKPAAPAKPEAAPTKPKEEAWKAEWEQTLGAAKKEGLLDLSGPATAQFRNWVEEFQRRYPEIRVEFQGAGGADHANKFKTEREAGQYLHDVMIQGTTTMMTIMRPGGMLAPLRPLLLLPEVTDDKAWAGGLEDGWIDASRTFIYHYQSEVDQEIWINRAVVPETELKSVDQLTEPRSKGQITWFEPRQSGAGNGPATHVLYRKGEPFLRAVLGNELVLTNVSRQQLDWVVRGQYPIGVGVDGAGVRAMEKEGLAKDLRVLQLSEGERVSAGNGAIVLVDRAPHPNAARVFVNWALSREAQAAYSRLIERNSRRADVPVARSDVALKPGGNYANFDKEDLFQLKQKAIDIAKDVIK